MPYWQIAAGSYGRDYTNLFLETGMAFIGGGTMGVAPGDRVALKRGQFEIVAVGEVVERNGVCQGNGGKDWLYDVDGWELPTYCYVDWRVPDEPQQTEKSLARGAFVGLHNPILQAQVDQLFQEAPFYHGSGEPGPAACVSDEEVLRHLVLEGLRPDAADELTTFRRIRLLANYYYNACDDWNQVREHETRSFLVLPLLLSLGWTEQKLKVEFPDGSGGRIDIAGFTKAFHKPDSECSLIVETKGFAQGLDFAPEQAERYAQGFDTCQVFVVSNGYCYKAYRRLENGAFPAEPTAYLNLRRPRDRHPLNPQVGGALQLLECLMP